MYVIVEIFVRADKVIKLMQNCKEKHNHMAFHFSRVLCIHSNWCIHCKPRVLPVRSTHAELNELIQFIEFLLYTTEKRLLATDVDSTPKFI
jgi:hypothetical protein